ncbi:MAG: hypothetical protein H7Y59_16840 [Anaerolineales bacterium]|nr:hypothetical protein [Anaerolineales bacterium]
MRLNANELDKSEALGLNVIRNDPRQRGFTQPCPVWQGGICTVYTSPDYPRSCRKYKCQVLREMEDDNIQLSEALNVIQNTFEMIREIEPLLPVSSAISFREKLITYKEILEQEKGKEYTVAEQEFLRRAEELLNVYDDRFGVDDFIDYDS